MPDDTSSAALSRLDAALTSGPYLLIDARNRRAGEDRSRHPRAGFVATLEQARTAVAAGVLGATTYAGTVRAGVAAFDIDAADPRLAAYLVEELCGWARRRQLWHLAVDSGGGPGRKHVFVVPERFSDELAVLAGLLRAERGLSTRELDDRTGGQLRPPGAPHRTSSPSSAATTATAVAVVDQLRNQVRDQLKDRFTAGVTSSGSLADGLVDELVDQLEAALARSRSASQHRPAKTRRAGTAAAAKTATVVSFPRSAFGPTTTPGSWPGKATVDNSRSAQEFDLTRQLVDAGETPENAWQVISGMDGKSASRGFSWWRKYLWNGVRPRPTATSRTGHATGQRRAGRNGVAPSGALLGTHPGARRPPQRLERTNAAAVVLPTFAANRYRWDHLETRQRHSLETVLWAILERLDPDRASWTSLSLRDLRLATGLDRATISGRLSYLVELGLIRRRQLSALDAADQWQLGLAARTALNPPAVLTPPAPCWCPSAPAGTTTTLLDILLPAAAEPPLPQLPLPRPEVPAPSSRQTQLAAARAAAAARVLHRRRHLRLCDRHHQLLTQVTAERDPFYESLRAHRTARTTAWEDGRRLAYTAAHQRHHVWWAQLPAADQLARRDAHRTRWAGLPNAARSEWLERRHVRRLVLAGDHSIRLHQVIPPRRQFESQTNHQGPPQSVTPLVYGEPSLTQERHDRDDAQTAAELARNTPRSPQRPVGAEAEDTADQRKHVGRPS